MAAKTPPKYYIVVTELNDRFPRRQGSDLPRVYSEISSTPPLQRFEQLRDGRGKSWAKGAHVRLCDVLPNWRPTSRREIAEERLQKARRILVEKGYSVGTAQHVYHVYVINLQRCTKGCKGEKGCVYVGYTSKSSEDRLAEHRRESRPGGRNLGARATKGRVIDLNRDLMPEGYVYSQAKALALEKKWMQKLMDSGYCVDAGHLTS